MKLSLFFLASFTLLAAEPTPHIKAALTAYSSGREAAKAGKLSQACALFEQAISIEPTFEEAWNALIENQVASNDQLAAAASLTKFLQIEPAAIAPRILLGNLLLGGGQAKRALAQFVLALQLFPAHADGLLGFAVAARQLGMNDRADEALEQGRAKYPLDERFRSSTTAAR